MNWYVRLLSRYPWAVLGTSGLLSLLSILCSLTLHTLPDFSDPQEGFESRGTEISAKLVTWANLLDSISHVGPLTTNPIQPVTAANRKRARKRDRKTKRQRKKKKTRGRHGEEEGAEDDDDGDVIVSSVNTTESGLERWRREAGPLLGPDHRIAWLCGDPVSDFSRVVYRSRRGESLFTRRAILSMCALEARQLKSVPGYTDLCESKGPVDCCPGWSLGGYVALLFNRTSCFTITESDVSATLRLVTMCAPHYRDGSLGPGCGARCGHVPRECRTHNAAFTILHFLADSNFSRAGGMDPPHLSYAVSFLPLARSSQMLDYYTNIKQEKLCDDTTEIVAMDLGLEEALFNTYLLEDASHLLVALLVIFLCVWGFTTSLTLTLACLSSIIASLGLAYFTYTFVLRLTFFPFMNVLAVVIAIGVGADDTFILSRVWSQKQSSCLLHPAKLEACLGATLHHALLSMLVTSATTAAAFLASLASSVTAIKCFSIFSSLTIVWNFVLMSTWVPAWLILHHKLLVIKLRTKLPSLPSVLEPLWSRALATTATLETGVRTVFEKILPAIIIKPRAVWISLSVVLLVLSSVATFYMPGLALPSSSHLQLLSKEHPFEQYALVFKEKFGFERELEPENEVKMPLRFVFGAVARDNGDYFNPGDRGSVVMDPEFDMSSKEAQSWMFRLCNDLKKQPWYKYTHGDLQLSNCFIITFKEFMYRPCYNDLSQESHRPCCRESVFPFEPAVFKECLLLAVEELYETPSYLWLPGVAGPKFDIATKEVAAVILEYEASLSFSYHYDTIRDFYTEVQTWFQARLEDAPPGLKSGFFVSYLEFYDLQRSLLEGSCWAVGVAMAASLAVLGLATRSPLLSLLAVTTILAIILATVAVLVLLGWQLNILESVVITLAIGLAVDFSLHYCIMYKLAGLAERRSSVQHSLAVMAGPVTMAALTTAGAGACLLPTRVLAYTQIGSFLVVLMLVSWLLSTFTLQSLLSCWGPAPGPAPAPAPSLLSCSSSLCCQLEDEAELEDEVENMKKAFTVSASLGSELGPECGNGGHQAAPGHQELLPLEVTLASQPRSPHSGYTGQRSPHPHTHTEERSPHPSHTVQRSPHSASHTTPRPHSASHTAPRSPHPSHTVQRSPHPSDHTDARTRTRRSQSYSRHAPDTGHRSNGHRRKSVDTVLHDCDAGENGATSYGQRQQHQNNSRQAQN